MKLTIQKITAPLLAAALLLSGATAYGAPIDRALTGNDGQMMSQVSTAAGSGSLGDANGTTDEAAFRAPWSLLVLEDGSVLIADARNHLIRRLNGTEVSAYAGITLSKDAYGYPVGGLLDGTSGTAVFQQPKGLAADSQGNVYVADAGNHAIRKIDRDGKVTTIAGNGVMGMKDGKGGEAHFNSPQDIAVAADGTIYVADTLNHAIRKIAVDGTVTTLNSLSERAVEVVPGQVVPAGDYTDGELRKARFNEPAGLAIDAKGNLYVSDSGNQLIRYIDLAAGLVSTAAGQNTIAYGKNELYAKSGFADGAAERASFNFPRGLTVTAEGGLLIADSMNHSIRYLKDGIVRTIAGQREGFEGSRDGAERHAEFHSPSDVAVMPDGSLLIADSYNNKLRSVQFYALPSGIEADDRIKVMYGEERIEFDAQPELFNGRTMVPVRLIAEKLGLEVKFGQNAATGENTVELTGNDTTIRLTIGKDELTLIPKAGSGRIETIKTIDAAPYLKEDRTYVPLRFFAEELGLDVQWDARTYTAILRDKYN